MYRVLVCVKFVPVRFAIFQAIQQYHSKPTCMYFCPPHLMCSLWSRCEYVSLQRAKERREIKRLHDVEKQLTELQQTVKHTDSAVTPVAARAAPAEALAGASGDGTKSQNVFQVRHDQVIMRSCVHLDDALSMRWLLLTSHTRSPTSYATEPWD